MAAEEPCMRRSEGARVPADAGDASNKQIPSVSDDSIAQQHGPAARRRRVFSLCVVAIAAECSTYCIVCSGGLKCKFVPTLLDLQVQLVVQLINK